MKNNNRSGKKGNGARASIFDSMVVWHEMIKGRGEDFYTISISGDRNLIGVFDGCGGSGSRRYAEYDNHTGAYIASRTAAAAVGEWFGRISGTDIVLTKNTVEDICVEIENSIYSELAKIKEKTGGYTLKGSILKNFPTTASVIYSAYKNGKIECAFMWCGDSRGYILQPSGLVQITRDDINSELDAMSNLNSDGLLSNVISADGKYIIHGVVARCDAPALLITATDGSFSYFSTPMEFEYMLLHTLIKSNDIEEWGRNIDLYLRPVAGDDYTVGISICGFYKFKAVKQAFMKREREIYKTYMADQSRMSADERKRLWNKYKLTYYGNGSAYSDNNDHAI